MKKNYNFLVLFLLIVQVIIGCSNTSKKNHKDNIILTGIPTYKFILDSLVDTSWVVSNLINEGDDPHVYNLTPQSLNLIKHAKIYVRTHIHFEEELLSKIKNINSKIKIIDPLVFDTNEFNPKKHYNPHTWLSPELLKKEIGIISDSLYVITKDSSVFLRKERLIDKLDSIDLKIKNMLKPYKGKKFIIFHPSLYHFAQCYGLIEVSLEYEGKDVSLKQIDEVKNIVQKDSLKYIIIQSEIDTSRVNLIKEHLNLKTIKIRPLKYNLFTNLIEIGRIIQKYYEKRDN